MNQILNFILNIVLLVIGFFLLIKGADLFVDGASGIAKKLKIPALIIGLTIVALGTSLPEFAVSSVAAIRSRVESNSSYIDMCVGNIVGSNIFNTLIVLGTTCLFVPVVIDKKTLKFEFPFLLGVTGLLMLIGLLFPNIGVNWLFGIIFVLLCVFYIVVLIARTKKESSDNKVIVCDTQSDTTKPLWKLIVFSVLGLGMIVGGGELTNISAEVIAKYCGMDEKLIALTVLAIGTSLPELITSLVAIKKGENDIALGNVVGSNILNILFILGTSSLITNLPISNDMRIDIIYLFIITLVLIVLSLVTLKKKGLSKISGIILVSLYIVYFIYILGRNYSFLPEWLLFV